MNSPCGSSGVVGGWQLRRKWREKAKLVFHMLWEIVGMNEIGENRGSAPFPIYYETRLIAITTTTLTTTSQSCWLVYWLC